MTKTTATQTMTTTAAATRTTTEIEHSDENNHNDQHPDRVVEFASSVCSPEADVLFCSCTAWRSMEAAEALENETGRPVVTSNQATVWAAFDRLGIQPAVTGFGSLLSGLMH